MNRKRNFLIIGGIALLLLIVVVAVVSKVFGSSDSGMISDCSPFNVVITKGEDEHTAVVNWSTKESCSSFVVYGDDPKNLDLVAVDSNNGAKSKRHTVNISSLLKSKIYYFSVVSDGNNYGKDGLPISFSLNSL